jgi:hypothetical protein
MPPCQLGGIRADLAARQPFPVYPRQPTCGDLRDLYRMIGFCDD